ncbi:hypothetical protein [Mycobacterium sp. OTB74]|jgi:hypothetical protein|uniref:hypothetical protein n=1 Tax=Mycobacterium sp. OTB74 TaxID=1853452 RepID=UPI00247410FF|nr:hypothetical protein [Mycobacterium sp. OTB74]MDH6243417.1 hypothetical protein [Mycobacterium sp. OTB74]
MERRRWIFRLFASALGALGMTCAVGIAHAQPAPSLPVAPSIIDQLVTSTPAISTNPHDAGVAVSKWGGVGMVCQNLTVQCR